MARGLLGQNVMVTAALSPVDRHTILRFAASFLWADLEVAESERLFLGDLARELAIEDADALVAELLERPPVPEDVDPGGMTPSVADVVRHVALRAIAADGRVEDAEMRMFEVLDDLLPRSDPAS